MSALFKLRLLIESEARSTLNADFLTPTQMDSAQPDLAVMEMILEARNKALTSYSLNHHFERNDLS